MLYSYIVYESTSLALVAKCHNYAVTLYTCIVHRRRNRGGGAQGPGPP